MTLALKIIVSVVCIGLTVAAYFFPASRDINVDHRFYRFGKYDPFYLLMGDDSMNLMRMLKMIISIIAVAVIVIVWFY